MKKRNTCLPCNKLFGVIKELAKLIIYIIYIYILFFYFYFFKHLNIFHLCIDLFFQ